MNDFVQGLLVVVICLVFGSILQLIKFTIKKKLYKQENVNIDLMSEKADYEEYVDVNNKTLNN